MKKKKKKKDDVILIIVRSLEYRAPISGSAHALRQDSLH